MNKKKLFTIIGSVAVTILCFLILLFSLIIPEFHYKKGTDCLDEKVYAEAMVHFEKISDYKDARDKLTLSTKMFHFSEAKNSLKSDDYEKAVKNFILAKGIENSYVLLEETAVKLVDLGKYKIANKAFDSLPNIKEKAANNYTKGMLALSAKKYEKAIKYFSSSNNFKNSVQKLVEAHYLYGKEQFDQKQYSKAKENFVICGDYKDSPQMTSTCDFMLAEMEWSYKSYSKAEEIYKTLPADFEYNGVSAASRLNTIKTYNAVKHLIGYYSVKKGDYKVTQTHNSTGIYHYWYNTSPGYGSFELDVKVNDDGTITVSGEAEADRYTSYSSIASGVKTGSYYARFSKTLTSGGLPIGTLYSDDYITLKYTGGTTFTLSYYEVDRSQDVYFNYTYTSNYTFGQ